MAEKVFKAAGVTTKEIDLSQPRSALPSGIPAGVIGTAVKGPAFVPVTVSSFADFKTIFGGTDGEKFGPIAVSEWLRTARSCTYLRVLGVGDGKKRNASTGNVKNAGFVVGSKQVQDTGLLGLNPFANDTANAAGTTSGRTYFLGCFMSESNGSTIFSDAGIQRQNKVMTNIEAGITGAAPATKSGINTRQLIISDGILAFTGSFDNSVNIAAPAATNTTTIGCGDMTESTAGVAIAIKAYIDRLITNQGLSISTAIASNIITLTANRTFGEEANGRAGVGGYRVVDVSNDSNHYTVSNTFTNDATGGAVPILRGVLLAPSGVILHLSGNGVGARGSYNNTPSLSATATPGSAATPAGRKGSLTGSVYLDSQEFVLVMNGFKGNSESVLSEGKGVITASFDINSGRYLPRALNTDPLKIESEGHLLYAHYDISPAITAVTGAGAVSAGHRSRGTASSNFEAEDIAFILTSSVARVDAETAAPSANVPVYESFEDRFTHAETPFIVSQGGREEATDLFKLVALDAGSGFSNKHKASILNIKKSKSEIDEYGTFDVQIRSLKSRDSEYTPLETWPNVNLDPDSERYIARVIGDQNISYKFDNDADSQKITVDGTYPQRSKFVRVEVGSQVKNRSADANLLPFGFRGPKHLVTSGSLLATEAENNVFGSADLHRRVVEPPFPYRKTVSRNTGFPKRQDSNLFWGFKTVIESSATQPNLENEIDESIFSFVKHFPGHRKDAINFSVGENAGDPMVNGSEMDSDKFNRNFFSFEKIKVRTGSDGLADPEQWISASFERGGVGDADPAAKTRAFKLEDLGKGQNVPFCKFTVPFQGGFDGVNIFKEDEAKLTDNAVRRQMGEAAQGEVAGNAVASYRKAIEIMGSKTDTDIQVLAIPGLRHPSVTNFAIDAIEDRFDAFYIMDIEERDVAPAFVTSSATQDVHVANTIDTFNDRGLDSSFAAAYFPDQIVRDPDRRTLVQVPPSVVVLGAFSANDSVGHPWTAPAGYGRGSLNVVETSAVKLNDQNLDDLSEARINPITAFPGTGVKIFGQKTLQANASALDRINVRRLLIDVRRRVRNVANTLLFEPNREETLERFSALVNPILQNIQEKNGLDRYKVVIDTTTTTQADVENNTIRGKIFVQPTRTAEFISIDFVVTNAGENI